MKTMVDAFIKIGNLTGESQDSDHIGWIDVQSWSWGANNPATVTGGGLGATSANVHDFSFSKYVDSSSSDLFKQMLTGVHHDKATLELRKSSGSSKAMVYLKIEFTQVFVTSISMGGHGGESGNYLESVSFAFKDYYKTYTKQEDGGGKGTEAAHGYDVALKQEK